MVDIKERCEHSHPVGACSFCWLEANSDSSTLLSELSTDELLEGLPDNLHLARNSSAPDHDRWRIFNSVTSKYIEPSFGTPKALLIHTVEKLEKQYRDWTGR